LNASFSIRVALLEDADAITKMLTASYTALMTPAYPTGFETDIVPLISKANSRLLTSGRYFAALDDNGSVIGAGGWSEENPETREIQRGIGHIRHFGVLPDWAGQGVGKALMKAALSDTKDAGIKTLKCCASLNGVAFYRTMGFTELGPAVVQLPGGRKLDHVAMVLSL